MGGWLGFTVEALVAVLLVVTIGYCVLVNRKLEQLRSDQSELRQIIRELNAATARAQTAITGLREHAQSAEEALRGRIEEAANVGHRLAGDVGRAESILSKLTLIAHAPRPAASTAHAIREVAARPDVRASSVGLGLLNAQQRSRGAA